MTTTEQNRTSELDVLADVLGPLVEALATGSEEADMANLLDQIEDLLGS